MVKISLLSVLAVLVLKSIPSAAQDQGVGGHDSSKLQIHIPHTLMKEGGYDHREALFGVPPYGGSLSQMLYYAGAELCDINAAGTKKWPSPYILMVDRGGCTFVQKVRNAQRTGASGVIIADNTCLCSAGAACTSEPGVDCEPREPIMADDGSGADITIPSFLMFKQDADTVKAVLKNNSVVQVEMAWSLPSANTVVHYQLWTTPTDFVAKEFLGQFKHASAALGSKAYFTPHNHIYDGIVSNCQNDFGENQCYNLCTNNGRYCATDPDNNLEKGISGADVVKESLRRSCIWKQYGEENGMGVQWWDYVTEFLIHCDTPDYFMNDNCVNDVYKRANVDAQKIDQCMSDSGGLEGDKKNTLLEAELKDKVNSGVVIIPAIFVNGAVIRGALNFWTVFHALCAGYRDGTQPDICKKCMSCPDLYGCAVNGSCAATDAASQSVSKTTLMGSLLGMAALFGVVGGLLYVRQRRQMRQQVRGIIAEYMPLEGDAKNGDFAVMDTQIS